MKKKTGPERCGNAPPQEPAIQTADISDIPAEGYNAPQAPARRAQRQKLAMGHFCNFFFIPYFLIERARTFRASALL